MSDNPTRGPGRFCLALDLKDDAACIAQYVEWHRCGGPPAAVTRAIRSAGIDELEIWLTGNRLFMILEAGRGFDAEAKARSDARDPEIQAWETLMSQFQQSLPWAAAGEKWVFADQIYALSHQPHDQ